jgi:hypothetical protein
VAFPKAASTRSHELRVQGLLVDPTVTGPVNLVEDSTYHLMVENLESETRNATVTIANESSSLQ